MSAISSLNFISMKNLLKKTMFVFSFLLASLSIAYAGGWVVFYDGDDPMNYTAYYSDALDDGEVWMIEL